MHLAIFIDNHGRAKIIMQHVDVGIQRNAGHPVGTQQPVQRVRICRM